MKRLALACCVVALAGCAASRLEPYDKVATEHEAAAASAAAAARHDAVVERVSGPYVPVEAPPERRVSKALLKPITINRVSHSLVEFAQHLSVVSGVQIDMMPDVADTSGVTIGAGRSQGNGSNGPRPILPPIVGPAHTSEWRFAYEGTVAGLLDTLAHRFDLSWSEVNGRVVVRRYQTQTFRLVALAGSVSGTNTISSGQSSHATGNTGASKASSTSQSASLSYDNISPWSAIESAVGSMLSPVGRLAVNTALGTLTVTDTASALERVEKFVRETNNAMSKQVALNVRVYSVTLRDSDQYGINWQAVYKSLSGVEVSLKNAIPEMPDASAFGVKILSSNQPGSVGRLLGGSAAVLKALSEQGRVTEQVSTTLVTLNNQPVPLQVGRQLAYLSRVEVVAVPNAGATTSLTPGQLNLGLDMSFVPHALDDGRILLQYAMTLSDLQEMQKYQVGAQSIQLPNVNVRSFIQRVSVRSGETLVLAGFEQDSSSSLSQGVGQAQNTWLGGSQNGSHDRVLLVIMVQPTSI